jgi:hypothetical protein
MHTRLSRATDRREVLDDAPGAERDAALAAINNAPGMQDASGADRHAPYNFGRMRHKRRLVDHHVVFLLFWCSVRHLLDFFFFFRDAIKIKKSPRKKKTAQQGLNTKQKKKKMSQSLLWGGDVDDSFDANAPITTPGGVPIADGTESCAPRDLMARADRIVAMMPRVTYQRDECQKIVDAVRSCRLYLDAVDVYLAADPRGDDDFVDALARLLDVGGGLVLFGVDFLFCFFDGGVSWLFCHFFFFFGGFFFVLFLFCSPLFCFCIVFPAHV